MQEATSNQCLQTSKELTPLYPASVATPAISFNAQGKLWSQIDLIFVNDSAEFHATSAAAAPYTPITDSSCFNPAGKLCFFAWISLRYFDRM